MPARQRARGAVALLLAGILLFGSVAPALADTDLDLGSPAVVANTGGDAILLRSDAGYQFTVLAQLRAGTTVTVLAGPVTGDDGNLWYRVETGGTTGYVFATFLARPGSGAATAEPQVRAATSATNATVGDAKAVVGTGGDGLRLRDGADLAAAVLTVVPEGAGVALTGAPRLNGGRSWYPVTYAGVAGWAVGDYLGAATVGAAPAATNQQALALTIGEHVAVSGTGGWDLRLRAASSLDAAAITAAPEGAVLRVLDGPLADGAGNTWYAVNYDGLAGYASAAYLAWTAAALTARQAPVPTPRSAQLGGGSRAAVSNTGGWPLRVRAEAGSAGGVVAAVPEGAVLRVTDSAVTDANGEAWYAVEYDGLTGYAKAQYLGATDAALSARQPLATASVAATTSGPALASGGRVAVGNTGGWPLRIRESMGLDGATYGAADEGTVLRVLDGPVIDNEGNAWYAVDYDGLSGYARASYLNVTDAALSARTVAPIPVVVTAIAPPTAPAPASPASTESASTLAAPAPVAPPAPAPAPVPVAQPVAQTSTVTGSFIWPAKGSFTQAFGVNVGSYGPGGHNGIDIANSVGTPVVAADGGVVTYAGWKGGLGNAVVIDHGNGMRTEYGHASSLNVTVGQRVSQGQVIMAMGSTGNSTGSHVHFSIIRNSVYVDPMGYLSR